MPASEKYGRKHAITPRTPAAIRMNLAGFMAGTLAAPDPPVMSPGGCVIFQGSLPGGLGREHCQERHDRSQDGRRDHDPGADEAVTDDLPDLGPELHDHECEPDGGRHHGPEADQRAERVAAEEGLGVVAAAHHAENLILRGYALGTLMGLL